MIVGCGICEEGSGLGLGRPGVMISMSDVFSRHETYDLEQAKTVEVKSPCPDTFAELALTSVHYHRVHTKDYSRCDSKREGEEQAEGIELGFYGRVAVHAGLTGSELSHRLFDSADSRYRTRLKAVILHMGK